MDRCRTTVKDLSLHWESGGICRTHCYGNCPKWLTVDTEEMAKQSGSRNALRQKSCPEYSVPALDKGLDILEALAAAASPLSLSEIARAVGQTPSAVFRLLNRLEIRLYVTRDPAFRQYSLSLKLLELAHTYPPVEHLTRVSGSFMRELADASRESVHLSVLSHARIVVLMDVASPLRIRFAHQVGSQFSPVTTNSGRLLLAYLNPEELNRYLAEDEDYTKMSKSKRDEFQEELKKIRRNRYAVSFSEERPGMRDIAVLVGNPAVGSTAALAIACLGSVKDKAGVSRIVGALHECASRITVAMGLSHER
jgi:DNA-binding IclR family transcriptional regulator